MSIVGSAQRERTVVEATTTRLPSSTLLGGGWHRLDNTATAHADVSLLGECTHAHSTSQQPAAIMTGRFLVSSAKSSRMPNTNRLASFHAY